MAKRRRQKPNVTGRNNTCRFVMLEHRILHSNAGRALSPNARSLLVELVTLYNGENNGSVYLAVQDAAHRMGVADHHAASRAFDELQHLGFIQMTQDAHFKVKASDKSRARCWRLTWHSGPGRKAPSSEFMTREPEPRTPAHRRMERGLRALKAYRKAKDQGFLPVVDSTMIAPILPELPPAPVVDSTTLNLRNGGKQPKGCMVDSHPYIDIPWGMGARDSLIGWWQPDWAPQITSAVFAECLAHELRSGASPMVAEA